MRKPTFIIVVVLVSLATRAAGQQLVSRFADEQLAGIIRDAGYPKVSVLTKTKRGSGRIKFTAEGSTLLLLNYRDGDLQLAWGVKKDGCAPADINTWNRTKRMSRAYLDREGDPILEADLLANAGLNANMVQEFIKVFKISKAGFRAFLVQNCR